MNEKAGTERTKEKETNVALASSSTKVPSLKASQSPTPKCTAAFASSPHQHRCQLELLCSEGTEHAEICTRGMKTRDQAPLQLLLALLPALVMVSPILFSHDGLHDNQTPLLEFHQLKCLVGSIEWEKLRLHNPTTQPPQLFPFLQPQLPHRSSFSFTSPHLSTSPTCQLPFTTSPLQPHLPHRSSRSFTSPHLPSFPIC